MASDSRALGSCGRWGVLPLPDCWVLWVAALACFTMGCSSETCPGSGCIPGLIVSASRSQWDPGKYVMTIDAQADGSARCEWDYSGSDTLSQACDPGVILVTNMLPRLTMRVEGRLRDVQVKLTRDGEVLEDQTVAPKYTDHSVYECQSSCMIAEVSLGE